MILIPLSMIWGIAVIADSAQFSTIISEVSDKNYVGTALTCQVALGFLLTAFVIRLMAAIAARYGWNWALASMALGTIAWNLGDARADSARTSGALSSAGILKAA